MNMPSAMPSHDFFDQDSVSRIRRQVLALMDFLRAETRDAHQQVLLFHLTQALPGLLSKSSQASAPATAATGPAGLLPFSGAEVQGQTDDLGRSSHEASQVVLKMSPAADFDAANKETEGCQPCPPPKKARATRQQGKWAKDEPAPDGNGWHGPLEATSGVLAKALEIDCKTLKKHAKMGKLWVQKVHARRYTLWHRSPHKCQEVQDRLQKAVQEANNVNRQKAANRQPRTKRPRASPGNVPAAG
jgi:hypothetical protein